MKLLVVICTILAVSQALSYSEVVRQEWNTFKLQHGKEYSSPKEEENRLNIFMENRLRIAEHNEAFQKGKATFETGLNKFADMTKEEVLSSMTGFRRSADLSRNRGQNYTRQSKVALPSSVDWRKEGAVTEVKNQGECGACWAFSATGALEGQNVRKTGKLVSLSEQNLIDCATSYGTMGCDGGDMVAAFQYMVANGDDTEKSYPYEGKDGKCRFDAKNVGAKATSFVQLPAADQNALKEAVANVGPVSVAMDASLYSFMSYKSGIYYDPDCSDDDYDLNHAVLVVGYGSEDGSEYWIVKNSWGEEWGESGYFRIAFMNDICGIATHASYPVV